MPDRLTPEQRHSCMSNIRGKNTGIELAVRKYLFHKGLRYRINDRNIIGQPDIVLRKFKTVIFVNGCFWHGHNNCKKAIIPKTNEDFWREKINANRKRDANVLQQLQKEGWKTLVVWECELKKSLFDATMSNLVNAIIKG